MLVRNLFPFLGPSSKTPVPWQEAAGTFIIFYLLLSKKVLSPFFTDGEPGIARFKNLFKASGIPYFHFRVWAFKLQTLPWKKREFFCHVEIKGMIFLLCTALWITNYFIAVNGIPWVILGKENQNCGKFLKASKRFRSTNSSESECFLWS